LEISHKFNKTQIKWGYMWWTKKNSEKYKQIFPDDRFDIIFEGEKLTNRLVDRKRNRVWLGVTWMKDNFNKKEAISMRKSGPNVKFERKNR